MRVRSVAVSFLLPVLLACGGTAAGDADASETGASATGNGGTGGATTTSTGGGGTTVVLDYTLSVITETEPGLAAALIEMHNETEFIITVQLGGADFWQIGFDDPIPAVQPASTDDVIRNVRVGYHTNKSPAAACIFVIPETITGETSLLPDTSYVVTVTGNDLKKLAIDVTLVSPFFEYVAYRGLRAVPLTGATELVLRTPGGESFALNLTHGTETLYEHVPVGALSVAEVSVTNNSSGLELSGALGIELSGSVTLIVGDGEAPGAAQSFSLE
ncbi:hypothetical protein JYT28_00175 [Desulfobulbus sp. AH-315-M07]|nr:hypothetical protein [Desulfobulbus sp. AH-315-M07]